MKGLLLFCLFFALITYVLGKRGTEGLSPLLSVVLVVAVLSALPAFFRDLKTNLPALSDEENASATVEVYTSFLTLQLQDVVRAAGIGDLSLTPRVILQDGVPALAGVTVFGAEENEKEVTANAIRAFFGKEVPLEFSP